MNFSSISNPRKMTLRERRRRRKELRAEKKVLKMKQVGTSQTNLNLFQGGRGGGGGQLSSLCFPSSKSHGKKKRTRNEIKTRVERGKRGKDEVK